MDKFEMIRQREREIENKLKDKIIYILESDLLLQEASDPKSLIERAKDLVRNA